MKTMGKNARKALGILALTAMIPVSAWAAAAPPAAGGPPGPPQQAFDACAGKKAGDTVQFTTPRGDNVAAVCREFDGKLAARPAWAGRGPGRGGRGPAMGMGFGRGNGYLTEALNLTAEQKTKIQSIMNEQYEKSAKLHEQLRNARGSFWDAASKSPYDDAAVRKLAAEQEKIHSEILVSRASAMNRVMAVLTPEQKEKAARIGIFGHGMGPGHGLGRGRGPGMGHGMGRGMGPGPDCPWR